mmetsp:Transcript_66059/g.214894  ORF Transcript_66059/g.214894 Transcript_66059/m.214894 type:complete len:174 (-) Transcript_66059:583-1104(-)
MGAVCSCAETKTFVEDDSAEVEQQTAIAREKAAHIADAAKEIAEGASEKGADVAEGAQTKVADVAEATQEKVTEVSEAAQETAAEAQEVVVAAAKEGTEVACATMDAAVAAVTGTMIVEFVAEKGEVKKVHFKTKKVGFEMAMHGGGCCGPVGQAQARRLAAGTAPTLTPSLA